MRISKWTRRILATAMGLLALGLTAPVHADTEVVGRVGTTKFDDPCGGGLVIGFDYMRGKAMDSIGAVCGTFTNGAGPGDVRNLGRHGGGGGDGPLTTRCPADQAVAGANIYTDKFGAIRHILMSCFPIGGTQVTEVNTNTNGGEDKMQQRADCPPGQFATGILGGATDLVDRLGFHCGVPPATAAAATTPQPQDIKGKDSDFAGVWETIVPEVNAKFRLTLRLNGNNVTGEMINEQDPKYNGTLTGTISNAKLTYTYSEPAVNATGGGFFIVSAGQTIAGFTHTDTSKTKYGWEGHRIGDAGAVAATDPGTGPGPAPAAQADRRNVVNATTVYQDADLNNESDAAGKYLDVGDTVTVVKCGANSCQISTPIPGFVYIQDIGPAA